MIYILEDDDSIRELLEYSLKEEEPVTWGV